MNTFLEKYVMPVAGKIAGQRHLQAVRDGIILAMPLLIIGSLFLIIANIPFEGYPGWMADHFGASWQAKLNYPVHATFDIMSLIVTFGIAYRLAEKYKVDPVSAGAVAVSAFLLVTPFEMSILAKDKLAIPLDLMGSKGLFVAIIISLLSTEIFRWVIQRKIVIKLPDGVPPAVSKSFVALIPGALVILVMWIIRLIFENTDFGSVHNIVSKLLYTPLTHVGASLAGAIVAVILIQLLWSCGIHGAAIVGGVMGPIWLSLMDQNRLANEAHHALPNVVTQQFFDLWIYAGGSGATLALVVAMIFRAKSKQLKSLGKLALGPGIFNINEPVTFGMPIVLNPLLIIPFIIAPVVLVITTYLSMKWGWVARPSGVAVPWTTPLLFSGYLATGGKISAVILQLVNFAISFIIYYPFLKAWDKQKLAEENAVKS
ncbi:PTS cellobiose transporter subunit IIC [Bacillus sp. RG28]|uniref:Permease IIC component n=1 Tax=Gottfriedia endophytica TaxID=2820819 RepID=A0A940NJC0_9BACI|nr:PTS cellobiose transporter subunit IIC [Gottfriedia endophytica]MBP0725187.1 PTS cellobiose transporter subunit IIC [Gottfriedia endophytica]